MIRLTALPGKIRETKNPRVIIVGVLVVAIYILAYILAKQRVDTSFGDFPQYLEAPIAAPIDTFFDWTGKNLSWFFSPIADVISEGLAAFETVLLWAPWTAVVAATVLLALKISSWRLAALCAGSLLFISALGLWDSTMITLSLMGISVLISVAIGIPLGIVAAFNRRFESVVRPVLDTMQVLPPFVYLMPVLFLFGVSGAQSVVLVVIYAIAPVIRLTNLGIRQVPPTTVETAHSHGATTLQTLIHVQLPLAKPSIMMGVNQTIMMALAMVIITAIVGSDGLGRDVYLALRRINAGTGLEAGLAIVLLAIMLDRLSYALARQNRLGTKPTIGGSSEGAGAVDWPSSGMSANLVRVLRRHRFVVIGAALILMAAVLKLIGGFLTVFPEGWQFSFAEPINDAVRWMTVNLHFITSWVRDSVVREYGLAPIETFLLWLPWPAFLVAGGTLAYKVAGRRVAILAVLGFLFIGTGGMWEAAMTTLSQVLTALVFTIIIAILVGIWASQSDRVEATIRPILDTMQTMPIFVYLIPVIMLWGIGPVPGIIATVLYALPPAIRMTNLGIRQVPQEVVETAQSYGATRFQTLTQVQIPIAMPTIMMGINQTMIMVLAMVIIAALVGAGGLGLKVLQHAIPLEMGEGFIAGISIVILAIVLDRMTQSVRGYQGFFAMGR